MTSASYIDTCINRVFGKVCRSYLMGIAILWIFAFHFYCWFKGELPWWIYFFSEGETGVDIFLFLSAYGLEASFKRNGIKKFYSNRARRILPVYFLFLIILFVIFLRDVPFNRIITLCFAQLTGLSLIQDPDFFPTEFEFDWFTPALIIYYALFPLISRALNIITKKKIVIEIITLTILIFISLLALRNVHVPAKLFLYRLPIFMLGVISYIHLINKDLNRLFIMYVIAFFGGLFSNQHWFLTSASVPILLTVYSLIQGYRPLYKQISFIGRYSYEIYLAHIIPVTNFINLYIFDNIYLHIFTTIVWTIIVATIFSYYQKYINTILK